jgi:hypothetical protein
VKFIFLAVVALWRKWRTLPVLFISKCFWRWCCITAIYYLDFIHRPCVLQPQHFKRWFFPSHQVKATQMGPVNRASLYRWTTDGVGFIWRRGKNHPLKRCGCKTQGRWISPNNRSQYYPFLSVASFSRRDRADVYQGPYELRFWSCNNSGTHERMVIKFGIEIMPFDLVHTSNFQFLQLVIPTWWVFWLVRWEDEDTITHLYACNNSRSDERIFMKFDIEIMPLDPIPQE